MEIESANCKCRVSDCNELEHLVVERPLKIQQEISGLDTLVAELHKVFTRDHVNIQDVQMLMAGYKSNPKDWKRYAKFDRFRYTRNLVDEGNGAFNIMILCWGAGHASAIHDHADSHCFMKLLSGSLEEVRYDWPENVEPEVMRKFKRKHSKNSITQDNPCDKMAELDINQNGDSHDSDSQNGGVQNGTCQGNCTRCQNGGDRCNIRNIGEENDEYYDVKQMEEIGRTRLEVDDVCYINDALGLHRMENPSHVDGAVSLHLYCPPFNSCRVFDARTGKPTEVDVTFWSMYGKKVKRVIVANSADTQ